MDFKRKVALLILAGLLMSLFGSYLLAMEPFIIKDVNGAQLELTEVQRNALSRCENLEPFLATVNADHLHDRNLIDVSDVPKPFMNVDNVRILADIINDPKQLDTIDAKKIVELFRLADYIVAPFEVVRQLARKVEEKIKAPRAEVAGMLSCKDFETMEIALHSLRNKVKDYRVNIHDLLNINRLKRDYDGCLDLSYDSTKEIYEYENKLESLKGIEKCVESPNRLTVIHLDNQNIKEVDLSSLKELFPNLERVSLRNNGIEQISQTQALRKLEVDLKGNPIKSITIKQPERCNHLKFITNNPALKVNFEQNEFSKKITWFKSLVAKTKLFSQTYVPPTALCALFVGGLAATVGITWMIDEWAKRLNYEAELQKLVLATNQEIFLSDSLLENLKGHQLSEMVAKFGADARIVARKEVSHLLPQVEFASSQKMFLEGAVSGAVVGSAIAPIGLMAVCLLDHLIGGEESQFSYYLQRNARENPYRVRVKTDNDIVKDFPSNYAYNLFGKF